MPDPSVSTTDVPPTRDPRDWVKILSRYREPSAPRSWFELAVTLGPFVLLWGLAWWSLGVSYWLTFALSLLNAAFLLRLFAIQHDCGHGSFFKNRTIGDWLGRVIGVLTLTLTMSGGAPTPSITARRAILDGAALATFKR